MYCTHHMRLIGNLTDYWLGHDMTLTGVTTLWVPIVAWRLQRRCRVIQMQG